MVCVKVTQTLGKGLTKNHKKLEHKNIPLLWDVFIGGDTGNRTRV